jgi:hypothetical protein
MTDRYTKAVLTIIALTLVGMLAAQLTPLAHAQSDGQCGAISHPCYVKSDRPLYVHVVPLSN